VLKLDKQSEFLSCSI